ncbi:dihydroorotase [Paludicola sp. MB14-C6]|uniref:dihydroorotase n=1 Tax=Paludihabitans sp. MB14-C6 TaxID=3070656 RepID=UPI0027DE0DBC|nr:dihydroorotase [Paludicola sp. MB14-C6]WMJ22413.1 dihydroorotase [Paludicola sp. MB14-C6]
MERLLVRNGLVIDPLQNINEVSDILIEDGKILKVGKNILDHTDKVLEAKGLVVMPGLVDMHVHLRDPGFTEKEDIYSGCNAALVGGITSLLCMPNTKPVIDNKDTIEYVQKNAQRAKARVYICGSISKGLLGEELSDFQEYKQLGLKAVSDDGRPVANHEMMKAAMKLAQENNLLTISHCEDLSIVNGGIMHKGEISEKLMVKGIDRLSEDLVTEREIDLARTTGTPIHIAHVSTKKAVDLVRQAKKEGIDVTCETCPHYFSFTHEKLLNRDADYRMNPPLRELEDVEAIIKGIQDGTIDCIATDHAPHTKREKQDFLKAPNGVIGLETSLAASVRFLVEAGHIDMTRLVELMSVNPAKRLGIQAGSLKPGLPADITLFDPKIQWTVLPERLTSKSKNTAFKFERLTGRVKYALVQGEIAYVMRY